MRENIFEYLAAYIHYPIQTNEPFEKIKFRMEQANLKQKNFVPCIGSKKIITKVLSRERFKGSAHVVVENLMGDSSKIIEGERMASQQRRLSHVGCKPNKEHA